MLRRLSLTDFRNHADALIVPDAAFVILTGENGAGKTNILEAISLLAPGRGLRQAPLSAMARQDGAGGFAIAAELDTATIGTGTTASAPERRVVRINGTGAAANQLSEIASILWLTPAMDRLFTDSPGGRRRFFDRLSLALFPAHAHHASRYEAAMRSRTKLLTEEGRYDAAWLSALEGQMVEHGMAIAAARAETMMALGEALALAPDDMFARPSLALEGWSDGDLASELRNGRGRDAAAGRALAGPHRTDVTVRHVAKDQPAALCSTGEQKALLLSIILAHAALVAERTGHAPLLLLDEVAAHLDPVRRAALFDRLATTGGQVFMTGTESALFDSAGAATRLCVDHSHVHPAVS